MNFITKKCIVCKDSFKVNEKPLKGKRSSCYRPIQSATCSRQCARDKIRLKIGTGKIQKTKV